MKYFFAALAFVLSMCFLAAVGFTEQLSAYAGSPAAQPVSLSVTESYTLRDYDGRLALFVGAASEPVIVYYTRTDSLPEPDAQMLAEGITVYDYAELRALVEDYTS